MARRDTRQRVVVARRDSRDVRRMIGELRVERCVRVPPVVRCRRERLRDDHLRGRVGGIALGEAGGIREARRAEEDVRLIEAVVEDRDLDALACGGERRPPHRRSADELRRAVEELVVGHARPDGRAADRAEARELRPRKDDGDSVEDDAVVPANARARHGVGDARLQRTLRGGEAAEIVDARRRAQVQVAAGARRRACEAPIA